METVVKESMVTFETSQGVEQRAGLVGLGRYHVVVEIYNPGAVLRVSEVLTEFKILVQDRAIYSGRAVVSSLVNAGTMLVVQATLDEASFSINSFLPSEASTVARQEFNDFLSQWQRVYKVLPEFKVVVADMQTFLLDLRLWLDQLELEIRAIPNGSRLAAEQEVVGSIGRSLVPAFDAMHERLEALSEKIPEELRPVHQNFAKRQLHPLMLCSPFAYRTYHKPLGYAGDYEMVNMIVRDPLEGSSLFAKAVNLWFLSQWPAKAHRNRIQYLKRRLRDECLRGARLRRPIRILNLGCGPAREVQEFMLEEAVSDFAQFTLLDFNEETLQHTTTVLNSLRARAGRRAVIQLQKRSVHQVLKDGARSLAATSGGQYDYIYCAGLFDYLSDRTCKQLMNIFYEWLAPGGLLAATNVDACKPFRHMLEFVLDWHLIYRGQQRGEALLPDAVRVADARFERDDTTVNIFIEARKPEHA